MVAEESKVGVIGLGYVGLPLVIDFCESGLKVLGFDIDEKKVQTLQEGKSYIDYIAAESIAGFIESAAFVPTTDFSRLREVQNIIIAVPTPLSEYREPDLSFVVDTVETIALNLQKGQLIVLESTTYPGTTREVVLPLLEESGCKVGVDFFLAYSPERVDPNNKSYRAKEIPKLVGGISERCRDRVIDLYGRVFEKLVPVSTVEVAEAGKLMENIFRSVNIAMVNEMKLLFDRMGIDIWEVIEASSTKPFGFMPFYPGPGLGGHCLPIDPFYLTWKARQYDFNTRFIELAGEINSAMPYYVVQKTVDALNERGKSIKGARVLILGVAYKKNVDDIRESPAVKIIDLLEKKGALIDYHDPHIPALAGMRKYPDLRKRSVLLTAETLRETDSVIIITDHDCLDFNWIMQHSALIIDTRNALKGRESEKLVKA